MASITINLDENDLQSLVKVSESKDKSLEEIIKIALNEYVVTENFLNTEVSADERSYFLSLGR